MEKPGNYRGRHFTEWVDTVKQLKRGNKLDEAIVLLEGLVGATEAESKATGLGVAPWYYEQLAIIHRKRKSPAAEVAILDRYASQPKAPGQMPPALEARLRRARELLTDMQEAAIEEDIPRRVPAVGSCSTSPQRGPEPARDAAQRSSSDDRTVAMSS